MLLPLPNDGGPPNGLDHFHDSFPEVFAPCEDPFIDEDFFPVPIDDPDSIPPRDQPSYRNPGFPEDGDLTAGELEIAASDLLTGDAPFPAVSPDLLGKLRGGDYGGGLVPWPAGEKVPPPDCLAFYLPIHFYHPGWWGVYLLFEGVVWLASYLLRNTGGAISPLEAISVARKFLYYHEAFHHKTECLSIRMEITHRVPVYKTGFTRHYKSTAGTDACLEEALANAEALKKVTGFPRAVSDALEKMVLASPPGYRRGVEVKQEFTDFRNQFAETNQRVSFPHLPHKDHRAWGAATHMFDGINNIKGKVNYLVPRTSPLLGRLRVQPMLPPRKLVKKLADLAGVTFKRPGGNHDLYQTRDGHVFPIPRHARDMNRGLLRGILRQCGIEMGLDEFLRA
jgi:predicted RNA binding protein YcfA (HicA-like mRNA interferase family)